MTPGLGRATRRLALKELVAHVFRYRLTFHPSGLHPTSRSRAPQVYCGSLSRPDEPPIMPCFNFFPVRSCRVFGWGGEKQAGALIIAMAAGLVSRVGTRSFHATNSATSSQTLIIGLQDYSTAQWIAHRCRSRFCRLLVLIRSWLSPLLRVTGIFTVSNSSA